MLGVCLFLYIGFSLSLIGGNMLNYSIRHKESLIVLLKSNEIKSMLRSFDIILMKKRLRECFYYQLCMIMEIFVLFTCLFILKIKNLVVEILFFLVKVKMSIIDDVIKSMIRLDMYYLIRLDACIQIHIYTYAYIVKS